MSTNQPFIGSVKRHVKVAVIGAGSAGLSALRQVKKATGDYVLIDKGPLGTTCVCVGCMPSKALIQVAGDFHRRRLHAESGITGSFAQLHNTDIVIGSVRFEDESRAVIEGTNGGILRLYVETVSGLLLGVEAACPGAEHLGHVLALAIQQRMTVSELLQMPFYHPTAEEALRAALLDAAQKLHVEGGSPLPALCGSCPEPPLC